MRRTKLMEWDYWSRNLWLPNQVSSIFLNIVRLSSLQENWLFWLFSCFLVSYLYIVTWFFCSEQRMEHFCEEPCSQEELFFVEVVGYVWARLLLEPAWIGIVTVLEKLTFYKNLHIFEATFRLFWCFSEQSIRASSEEELRQEDESVIIDHPGKVSVIYCFCIAALCNC